MFNVIKKKGKKERRVQPNHKTNPPMIMSAKNYIKKKKKQTGRTLGQMVKAKLYRQNHTKKHTHAHSQKEEKGKNISISLLPKSTS